jgi:MFS transporter, MHS family, proline/betaine transporter
VLGMRETAKRPLVGSVPTVETRAEAVELVEGQDENPLIDTTSMPLVSSAPEPELESAPEAELTRAGR